MRKTWFSELSRRDFLQTGALGAAGLAVGATVSPLMAQAGGLMTEHVATFNVSLDVPQVIGQVADGFRQIVYVKSGTVSGTKLNGTILPGGGDWLRVRSDGVFILDVRVTLELDDGQLAFMNFLGYSVVSPDVFGQIMAGEETTSSQYYVRIAPRFETASEEYAWLNHTMFVGIGQIGPRLETVSYEVYQIL